MASKQPRRSDLTSDLKFIAQTTYATMFVRTDLPVLKLFSIFLEERKKEEEEFVSTRVVGFAATKNIQNINEQYNLPSIDCTSSY